MERVKTFMELSEQEVVTYEELLHTLSRLCWYYLDIHPISQIIGVVNKTKMNHWQRLRLAGIAKAKEWQEIETGGGEHAKEFKDIRKYLLR
jgi:hypothetical protein